MNDTDIIELRSEKIRNIIEEIPPIIVRFGIGIIFFIFLTLTISLFFMHFPETVNAESELITTTKGKFLKVMLPYHIISQINRDTSAKIEFEGYDSTRLGIINAIISTIDKTPVNMHGKNFFTVEMRINKCPPEIQLKIGMKGKASLLLSNETFAEKLFNNIIKRDIKGQN